MSFWWPPPRYTQYPDWTAMPEDLLAEAQRLRFGLSFSAGTTLLCTAAAGAGCALAACAFLAQCGVVHSLTEVEYIIFGVAGALLGLGVAAGLPGTATVDCRAFATSVLSSGVLVAALGPDVRTLFPNLHNGRHEYWPRPDLETARMRVNAIRSHYSSCAAARAVPAWPSNWNTLCIACWFVPAGLFLAMTLSDASGRHQPYSPMPWAVDAIHFFGANPLLAWLAVLLACALTCLAAGLSAAMSAALDGAMADALEQLGSMSLAARQGQPAPAAAAPADPQTEAYDDVPSGWS